MHVRHQSWLVFVAGLGLSLVGPWSTSTVVAREASNIVPPAERRFSDPQTAEVPDFQRHVLPLLGRLGCNGRACHGSFQGQGGFRLSLFGYDFKQDHDALTAGKEPRVDKQTPANSLMLTKPLGGDDDHGGGHRLDRDSWQHRLLTRWIESGANTVDEERAPTFVRLEVRPLEIVFAKPGETARLQVFSHWSDGTVEDVTPLCRFQSNDDAIAKIDTSGKITVLDRGDCHVVAFYDNGVVPVSVLLPVSEQVGPKYPAVPTPTKVDELVVAKLRKLGVLPAELCSDEEFLRRASLDITGQLPTSDEVLNFLAEKSPTKRTAKVDELLERPAYSAWWATKLCDILGNSEGQLIFNNGGYSRNPSEEWYRWVERRLRQNMPYDELVAGVVLATGRLPDESYDDYCKRWAKIIAADDAATPAEWPTMPHYWSRRNMRKSSERALSFSYAFLGVRLQCAECHKHPFDQWSQEDFKQFTAFFDRVSFGPSEPKVFKERVAAIGLDNKKLSAGDRTRNFIKAAKEGQDIPMDEVFIATSKNRKKDDKGKNTGAGRVITPKVLGGDELVEENYADPRQPLMDWLRQKDNPYFARSIVNRVWAHYFNVGIVEPPDDMNLANAPSNRALLDWLAEQFIEHQFDLKWLHRTIVNSRTYQLGWQTNPTNENDLRNYSHAIPRRLPAEVVYDAVMMATAGDTAQSKFRAEPMTTCAIGLSRGFTRRGGNDQYALVVFGKPRRETTCDCERSNEPSLLQTVFLRNDQDMFKILDRKDGWLVEAAKELKALDDVNSSLVNQVKTSQARVAELEKQRDRLSSKSKDAREKASLDKLKAEYAAARKALASAEAALDAARNDPQRQQSIVNVRRQLAEDAYLRFFNRRPTPDELRQVDQHLAESTDTVAGIRDLVWALVNSKEFVVNH